MLRRHTYVLLPLFAKEKIDKYLPTKKGKYFYTILILKIKKSQWKSECNKLHLGFYMERIRTILTHSS